MLKIRKILLPVDFPNTSLGVIHEAATLARHFNSEIIMLHVMTARSRAAGVPKDGNELAKCDVLAMTVREAQKQKDHSLELELYGINIQRVLVEDDSSSRAARWPVMASM
jgi:hypothetical protein